MNWHTNFLASHRNHWPSLCGWSCLCRNIHESPVSFKTSHAALANGTPVNVLCIAFCCCVSVCSAVSYRMNEVWWTFNVWALRICVLPSTGTNWQSQTNHEWGEKLSNWNPVWKTGLNGLVAMTLLWQSLETFEIFEVFAIFGGSRLCKALYKWE